MKKNVIYLIMVTASVFAYSSCKTSSDPTPATVTHKFVINGTTYTETASADSASSISGGTKNLNVLAVSGQSSDKSATGVLEFIWLGTSKPKAGSYKVSGNLTTMTSSQVAILALDKVTVAKQGFYGTTGKDNVAVVVAVSSTGKLSITMPSIVVAGTNFDNTDPKNTVTTDVTGTISGTAGE
jgi:hypothetical protein